MKYLSLLFIPILIYSCNQQAKQPMLESSKQSADSEVQITEVAEEFKEIDVSELNYHLTKLEVAMSAIDVMKLYYPLEIETQEGNEEIIIQDQILENGHTLVTLIHDNFLDDSLKGEKYLMELQKSNTKWTVISLKKNWKCWEGRGHTDWGIEFCL